MYRSGERNNLALKEEKRIAKSWRESRLDSRGFEIMKFTGGLIPLTCANRVLGL